jgi:molybdate transport system substrate-binding protein
LRPLPAAIVGAAVLVAGGCAPEPDPAVRTLVVLAASSLKEPLDEVVRDFESRYPELRVRVSYAGSQDLAAQVLAGAPADLFLCAGREHLERLREAGALGKEEPRAFASNRLAVLFRADSRPLENLEALAGPGLRLALGAENVPIGKATRSMLAKLPERVRDGILANVRSYEASDLALVAKVRLGEADAAVVYTSDAASGKELGALPIPPKWNVAVTYFAAVLPRASSRAEAEAFLQELLPGGGGHAALLRRGLETPVTGRG